MKTNQPAKKICGSRPSLKIALLCVALAALLFFALKQGPWLSVDADMLVTIAIIALVINTTALLFVIFQTWLAKQSLSATRKSIDDSKTQRQLEILPKFAWVIEVQVQLEYWKKDLTEKIDLLQKGMEEENDALFQKVSDTKIKSPEDLLLNKFLYDNMPAWLRELWMSGAQYYYDAMAPLPYIFKDKEPNYSHAESWIKERGEDSLQAISKLLEYLEDMVPSVILNAPASFTDADFLRDQ
jgi:hypothetical protein